MHVSSKEKGVTMQHTAFISVRHLDRKIAANAGPGMFGHEVQRRASSANDNEALPEVGVRSSVSTPTAGLVHGLGHTQPSALTVGQRRCLGQRGDRN